MTPIVWPMPPALGKACWATVGITVGPGVPGTGVFVGCGVPVGVKVGVRIPVGVGVEVGVGVNVPVGVGVKVPVGVGVKVGPVAIVQVLRQALSAPGVGIAAWARGWLLGTLGTTGSVPICCNLKAVITAIISKAKINKTPPMVINRFCF